MKRKKAQRETASAGTVLAAQARAEGNKWTDAKREKLGEEFMKLCYAPRCANFYPPSAPFQV
jgi:hypothetical protein